MKRYRILMLAYAPTKEIRLWTQAALDAALESTSGSTSVTLGINGGASFPVRAHERLSVTYWDERLGLGDAYNRLAGATTEPFLVFLHNDCIVPTDNPAWLEILAATAAQYGFAFPMVEEDRNEAIIRGIRPTYDQCPPSCCYVVRRDVWGRLGGFDEAFQGCHFEDLDLFMRGHAIGCTMAQVEEVTVFHRRGTTRAETVDESNLAFRRNQIVYQARWGGPEALRVPGVVRTRRSQRIGGEANGGPSNGSAEGTGHKQAKVE